MTLKRLPFIDSGSHASRFNERTLERCTPTKAKSTRQNNEGNPNHKLSSFINFYIFTTFITLPRERWIPEHSMHSVMPRLMEAHRGSGKPQSQHLSFPGIDINEFNVEDVVESASTTLQCNGWSNIQNRKWKANSSLLSGQWKQGTMRLVSNYPLSFTVDSVAESAAVTFFLVTSGELLADDRPFTTRLLRELLP